MVNNQTIFDAVNAESEAAHMSNARLIEELTSVKELVKKLFDMNYSLTARIVMIEEQLEKDGPQTAQTVRAGTKAHAIIDFFDTHPNVMCLKSSDVRRILNIKHSAQSNKAMDVAAANSNGRLVVGNMSTKNGREKIISRRYDSD